MRIVTSLWAIFLSSFFNGCMTALQTDDVFAYDDKTIVKKSARLPGVAQYLGDIHLGLSTVTMRKIFSVTHITNAFDRANAARERYRKICDESSILNQYYYVQDLKQAVRIQRADDACSAENYTLPYVHNLRSAAEITDLLLKSTPISGFGDDSVFGIPTKIRYIDQVPFFADSLVKVPNFLAHSIYFETYGKHGQQTVPAEQVLPLEKESFFKEEHKAMFHIDSRTQELSIVITKVDRPLFHRILCSFPRKAILESETDSNCKISEMQMRKKLHFQMQIYLSLFKHLPDISEGKNLVFMPSLKHVHFYPQDRVQNDHYTASNNDTVRHFDKRAIGIIFMTLAAALGAAGIGTSTSAMAAAKQNAINLNALTNAHNNAVTAIKTNYENALQLNNLVKDLEKIIVNTQKETNKALSSLERSLHMNQLEDGVNTLIQELDTEIFRLADAIKDSVLSKLGSNFLLTENDLNTLARIGQQQTRKTIGTDFFQISVTMVRDNQNLILLIEAPITPEASLFKFYRFTPIPIFRGNRTLIAKVDKPYIAIDPDHTRYALYDHIPSCVSVTNKRICTDDMFPVSQAYMGHCPTELFTNLKGSCTLTETSSQDAFLMRSGKFIVYSSKDQLTFSTQCGDKFDNNPVTMTDFGLFEVNSSCTCLVAQGQRQFRFPGKTAFKLESDQFIHQIIFLADTNHRRLKVTYETPAIRDYQLRVLPQLKRLIPSSKIVSTISKTAMLAIIVVFFLLTITVFLVVKYRGSIRRLKSRFNDAAQYITVLQHQYESPSGLAPPIFKKVETDDPSVPTSPTTFV